MDAKGLVLKLLFPRWRGTYAYGDGYSVILPMPMDMPFLLRFALEGLRKMRLDNCRSIIVVPDGCGARNEGFLQAVVAEASDLPLVYLQRDWRARLLARQFGANNLSALHWFMIVRALERTPTDYVLLHDADAFFVSTDALESQYQWAQSNKMDAVGVTARWDPFFREHGYVIPGTWELMFSTRWARRRPPLALKGRVYATPHGPFEFDTMLYPQFLDAPDGHIAVLDPPPRIAHFNGTIVTYRKYREQSHPVCDELFRLLLLSMLETLLPSQSGARLLPPVEELVRGLTDSSQPVHYCSPSAAAEYGPFRQLVSELCRSPVMAGERARALDEWLMPFDAHFAAAVTGDAPTETFRYHGLGR